MDLQHSTQVKEISLDFIFYSLQIIPIVYIRLYYCLKYYKTVHSFSVFMKCVPDEVLYVLTRAF